MQIDHANAGIRDRIDEFVEPGFRIHVVNANAAFHGDGKVRRSLHRCHAFRHESRFRHEARAKAA